MSENNYRNENGLTGKGLSKNRFPTKTLVTMALMSAISIILSRFCVIYFTDSLRLDFGKIPIMITGLLFGPFAGAIVGFGTDLVGSLFLSGRGWYPPLALTPVVMGIVAGLFRRFVLKKQNYPRAATVTLTANILGSICWSTYCLSNLYKTPFWTLASIRVPFYLGVSLVEALLIFILFKARAFDVVLRDSKYMKKVKNSEH